jgi:hypothetical protein
MLLKGKQVIALFSPRLHKFMRIPQVRRSDAPAKSQVLVCEVKGGTGAWRSNVEAVPCAGRRSRRLYSLGHRTSFIGFDAVDKISYVTHRNENTHCYFCKNKCLRTFIDVQIASSDESWKKSKIPILVGVKRLIVGKSCEKGLVEDVADMREIKKGLDTAKKENPNMAETAAKAAFRSYAPPVVADPLPKLTLTPKQKRRLELMKKRASLRIGIPRILNMYSVNPILSAYFEALGVPAENLIYSDYTSETLYKEGAKRGAIDPCFPSKVGIPHVHNLLYVHHKKKPLDIIFCPMIDDLPSDLKFAQAHRSCPTVATTPEAVKAAFTKEGDIFKENGILLLDTFVNPGKPALLAKQLFDQFVDVFGLSWDENFRSAVDFRFLVVILQLGEVNDAVPRRVEKQLQRKHHAKGLGG